MFFTVFSQGRVCVEKTLWWYNNCKRGFRVNEILLLNKVCKTYGKTFALKNISLGFKKGIIAGIVGPNGAGKSTLLKIIAGYVSPNRGEVLFFNKRFSFMERQKILSYMPETLDLYPDFYVSEIVDFVFSIYGESGKNLLDALKLHSVFDKKIKQLSKGFKQRVKLFLSLSGNKEIILLDEPFDGFDPLQMKEIFGVIKTENEKGKTFVLSIHHLNHAEKICNYFVLMKDGEVVSCGTLERLKKNYGVLDSSLEEVFERALS